jgi:hypothetical protein
MESLRVGWKSIPAIGSAWPAWRRDVKAGWRRRLVPWLLDQIGKILIGGHESH